jgi:transcriptional regulator with PAS, ATPase and Fis domain
MVQHGRKHGIQLERIDPAVIDALRQYTWPGNIRELENVLRRAVLYSRGGQITVSELPSTVRGAPAQPLSATAIVSHHVSLEAKVDLAEKRIIVDTLSRHRQSRSATAKELGISRVTLYNKMKKFGLLT